MAFLQLDHRYDDIIERARKVTTQLSPLSVTADNSNSIDEGVAEILRDSGLMSLMVPASHGGSDLALDPVAICLVREALMGECSHADSLFALQGIGSFAITHGGSADQQEQWLPQVGAGTALAGLALTEPVAGSDLKSITTNVTTKGGDLVLNGHKSFISNAGAAAFYTTLVKEDAGLSLVLVPADLDGITTTPSPELIAPHVLGDVVFDNVVLPESARLGEPGRGLNLVLSTLATFRISVAAASVGLGQTALNEATRHARERTQFGRPLNRLGPVAGLLADSWADLESTRLLTYRAAELAQHDPLEHIDHSSLAKLAATEACCRIVDRCVQVMGRWGLIRDSRIERCYRQARPMRIYEGASEVLRLGISRRLSQEVD
ncbi:acyl-CoA dehydrogenase family protein [Ilumatobacter sp.]|uniref:acyl-CoA dehydrogenase family protein n=1 Tax=Ilumatobacter sp. TaxID=1967498 RepID=UPI00375075BA